MIYLLLQLCQSIKVQASELTSLPQLSALATKEAKAKANNWLKATFGVQSAPGSACLAILPATRFRFESQHRKARYTFFIRVPESSQSELTKLSEVWCLYLFCNSPDPARFCPEAAIWFGPTPPALCGPRCNHKWPSSISG